MLIQVSIDRTPAVERLIQAWAQIYSLNLQEIPLMQPSVYAELMETASPAGRAITAAKLDKRLLELRCQVASIQTSSLYTYMQTVMDFREVKRLVEASLSIYKLLVELYQQNALGIMPTRESLANPAQLNGSRAMWGKPNIEAIAAALEPCLLKFQQAHEQSPDWRTLGFLTTQLNFCNRWLLWSLTPIECMLLRPYLMFVEEQVAHPWQRVCAAAAKYHTDSPVLTMVEKMAPKAGAIAQSAYQILTERLPRHRSRRGGLETEGVTHSCTRDFKMFQAYLWLCVLEQSLDSVENELLDLCIRVLPSVGVKWEMTSIWTQVLADALMRHLEAEHRAAVQPYTDGMQQIFLNAKEHFDTALARSI